MRRIQLLLFVLLVSALGTAQTPKNDTIPSYLLSAFKARSIGPAVMGGRVSAIALDTETPPAIYVGLATGGIMKSVNDGASFDAIFDGEAVASIGALAVSPQNPKIVWAGTGEANDRNSSAWGDGVYLSRDGGGSWKNVGLRETKAIARIVLHPRDTNVAWVAAAGDLWNFSKARGLYKTTDGGSSWKAVLTASSHGDRVGCGDVVADPSNPDVLYAALYARRRTPWSFVSGPDLTDGKDLGGIYRTADGGASWTKLGGLPARTGRIGLDISQSNPKVVMAVIQSDDGGTSSIDEVRSKRGGVFRSEDAGATWTRVSPVNPRPFYFSQIRIDPADNKRVYLLGFMLHVSSDSGRTFREDFFDKVHPDCHELVIYPKHPKRILLGTDGGIYQSYAAGKGWAHLNTFAAGEYYRITADMSTPYRIAGGLQDNLNWVGPSATRFKDGILNSDWLNIGGGDGFSCVFDADEPEVVYAEAQQGYVYRFNMRTGEYKGLRPEPAEGQPAFRFHWNSPLIGSPHDKDALYLGGNRVFKLTKNGEEFTPVSPDLSTQDLKKMMTTGSGAENYGVVYTLAESPLRAGLLWAGTDDGKLWITSDGGGAWTDLTGHLPAAVKGEWISRVEASAHDPQAAYLAVDAHRSGNDSPLAYRTGDGGKSWKSIAGNLPKQHPVKVVREDPANPNLLFAGTEFALFVSTDRGEHWAKFGGLPTVAVDDILIHPRERDLVVATHGRSLYVVDDLRPLELLVDSVKKRDAYLFPPRPAFGAYKLENFSDWQGSVGMFRGANPPDGALISYYVKGFTGDGVKITVTDAADNTVANLSGPGTPGINRLSWDLRMTKDLLTGYGGEGEKFVRSGEYTLTLSYGKTSQRQKLQVTIAPGIETR